MITSYTCGIDIRGVFLCKRLCKNLVDIGVFIDSLVPTKYTFTHAHLVSRAAVAHKVEKHYGTGNIYVWMINNSIVQISDLCV